MGNRAARIETEAHMGSWWMQNEDLAISLPCLAQKGHFLTQSLTWLQSTSLWDALGKRSSTRDYEQSKFLLDILKINVIYMYKMNTCHFCSRF